MRHRRVFWILSENRYPSLVCTTSTIYLDPLISYYLSEDGWLLCQAPRWVHNLVPVVAERVSIARDAIWGASNRVNPGNREISERLRCGMLGIGPLTLARPFGPPPISSAAIPSNKPGCSRSALIPSQTMWRTPHLPITNQNHRMLILAADRVLRTARESGASDE